MGSLALLKSRHTLEVVDHGWARLAVDWSFDGEPLSRKGWWRDEVAKLGCLADLTVASSVNVASFLSCSWWLVVLVLVRATKETGKVGESAVGDQ